jgi:hypothetical protein
VEDTGINSVTPSIRPSTITCQNAIYVLPCSSARGAAMARALFQ